MRLLAIALLLVSACATAHKPAAVEAPPRAALTAELPAPPTETGDSPECRFWLGTSAVCTIAAAATAFAAGPGGVQTLHAPDGQPYPVVPLLQVGLGVANAALSAGALYAAVRVQATCQPPEK
jgi:hypothetical protein